MTRDIAEDTELFDVYARTEPDDAAYPDSEVQLIAKVFARSELVTSNFGDTRLFFQHAEMDDDEDGKPEWQSFIEELDTSNRWGN